MEVALVPNRFRPGVGPKPARVAQRPWLPQHARLCPVLEAGSALGFLVYPPLRPEEAFQVAFTDGKYHLTYFREAKAVFRLTFTLPGGGAGSFWQELAVGEEDADLGEQEVAAIRDALIFPHHFGQPTGAVGVRGAFDFRTPPGWDTVYAAVANQINPPVLPVLAVRVETDWYAHDTEFRYVLPPGEVLHVAATVPIGQVFFVPREDATLRDASEEEATRFGEEREEFDARKAADQLTAPYGLRYSPLYQKERKGRQR